MFVLSYFEFSKSIVIFLYFYLFLVLFNFILSIFISNPFNDSTGCFWWWWWWWLFVCLFVWVFFFAFLVYHTKILQDLMSDLRNFQNKIIKKDKHGTFSFCHTHNLKVILCILYNSAYDKNCILQLSSWVPFSPLGDTE